MEFSYQYAYHDFIYWQVRFILNVSMYSITFLLHTPTVSYVTPGNLSETVIVLMLPHM